MNIFAMRGGAIHPVVRHVYVRLFPQSLTFAVHIRAWLTRWATLEVTFRDEDGAIVPWAEHSAGQTRWPIPPVGADPVWGVEHAQSVVLPEVVLPEPQRFYLWVEIREQGEAQIVVDRVELPIEASVSERLAPNGVQRDSRWFPVVAAELRTALAPETRRLLRSSAFEARRLGQRFVETGHLATACRRALGAKSGLPSTDLLREALEQMDGLGMTKPALDELRFTPRAAQILRHMASTAPGPLSPGRFLAALLDGDGGSLGVVDLARRLDYRLPR